MAKDLTNSPIERQNVLNNPYAIEEIQKATQIKGVRFEGSVRLVKEQVAQFFEVTPRTIDNLLQQYGDELRQNGYEVLKGKRLKSFKLCVQDQSANEIDFVTKTTVLGIFDFRTFLNVAMLLSDSERARLLRQLILDIVIDTINTRTGGGTKYINQRDEDFIYAYFQEENYRKDFTDALKDYVDMGNFKYPMYTNKIYRSIFLEDAEEYRKILRLHAKDKVRDTTVEEKLIHLFFCANKFHCFEDGNKRIAISLGAQFLHLNGYLYCVQTFIREMENISYHLAAGKIDKDLLGEIIQAIIHEDMDNEGLKLKILTAIENK